MGTHPIFESDFDCLTDKKKTGKKRKTFRHGLHELTVFDHPDVTFASRKTFLKITWTKISAGQYSSLVPIKYLGCQQKTSSISNCIEMSLVDIRQLRKR